MTYSSFVLSRLEMKAKEQKINSTLVINNYIDIVLSSSIMVRVLAILKYSLVLCRSRNDNFELMVCAHFCWVSTIILLLHC